MVLVEDGTSVTPSPAGTKARAHARSVPDVDRHVTPLCAAVTVNADWDGCGAGTVGAGSREFWRAPTPTISSGEFLGLDLLKKGEKRPRNHDSTRGNHSNIQ